MWFIEFIKKIWDEIDDLIINIIVGFLAKMFIFYLSMLAKWMMGNNGNLVEAINKGDDIASASIFYIFLFVGIMNYMGKNFVRAYYNFIDYRNVHSARVEKRKNQLLEDSMDQLPGKSGEILETKADEINDFNPFEGD
ncbi:hypothetical protein COD82_19165 [Bacillus cereus]|uniref:hypothetical protein n=1 Tax=Bacillus cereus TaxID=1396 RepID=UPI000BF920E4|nr:hypothetical protein [Bacillus cereus]MEB9844369.1 hypothetical protein [Bacillus cereus]MEC0072108.1 hypothetical protein [Bacillus cereus]PEZ16890.1 hypothetical protein CN365_21065 [Bacillus cereus]PEZ97310.1 hypothetical protein CN375_16575 [Bacillus cereus]PFX71942.1 hypothetical protein COL39_21105 [Bacillus cereus]